MIPQPKNIAMTALSNYQRSIVKIAALTTNGNLEVLRNELALGLEAGLTINQINDLLAQLYAYCGFPRSLNGIVTFMNVIAERKAKGIIDQTGNEASTISEKDRYEKGRITLEQLTGKKQEKPAPGFGEFNPTIDRFLKEHLFADIFDSDLLSYQERELITIAALSTLVGVDGQLSAHVGMGINIGITDIQLRELFQIIGEIISIERGENAKMVYSYFEKSKQ